LGAIVAKAAAVSIKTVSPERHYRDLAFLLSLPADPMALMRTEQEGRYRALGRERAGAQHRSGHTRRRCGPGGRSPVRTLTDRSHVASRGRGQTLVLQAIDEM